MPDPISSDKGVSLLSYIASQDLVAKANAFMADQGSRYQQMYNKILKDKGYWIPGAN